MSSLKFASLIGVSTAVVVLPERSILPEIVPLLGNELDETNEQDLISLKDAFKESVEVTLIPPKSDRYMDTKQLPLKLYKHVTLPPYSQLRVQVATKCSGHKHIEPKALLCATYLVRAANSVHDVKADVSFLRCLAAPATSIAHFVMK